MKAWDDTAVAKALFVARMQHARPFPAWQRAWVFFTSAVARGRDIPAARQRLQRETEKLGGRRVA